MLEKGSAVLVKANTDKSSCRQGFRTCMQLKSWRGMKWYFRWPKQTLESCCSVCNRTNRNITQGSSVKSICDNDRCMLMIVGAWSVHQKVEKRTQLGEHMQIIRHATDADPTENYQANDEDATRKNVTTKWKASAELALLFNMWKGNIPKIHVVLACHEL